MAVMPTYCYIKLHVQGRYLHVTSNQFIFFCLRNTNIKSFPKTRHNHRYSRYSVYRVASTSSEDVNKNMVLVFSVVFRHSRFRHDGRFSVTQRRPCSRIQRLEKACASLLSKVQTTTITYGRPQGAFATLKEQNNIADIKMKLVFFSTFHISRGSKISYPFCRNYEFDCDMPGRGRAGMLRRAGAAPSTRVRVPGLGWEENFHFAEFRLNPHLNTSQYCERSEFWSNS